MEDQQQTEAKEHHYKPVRLNKHIHDQFGVIPRMQGWFNIQKYKTDIPVYVYTSCIAGGNPLVCLTIPLNLHSYRSAYSVLTTQVCFNKQLVFILHKVQVQEDGMDCPSLSSEHCLGRNRT